MPIDLDAARRLHDRDPYNPRACVTCHEGRGGEVDWPCPTALALGSTGRSEWIGTPSSICGATMGTTTTEDQDLPCIRQPGHTGNHTDATNGAWDDPE